MDPGRQQDEECHPLTASWMFSILGALVAIPLGIRRKSLSPLVFFGSAGAMADIVAGVTQCEIQRREHEQQKQLEQIQALDEAVMASVKKRDLS